MSIADAACPGVRADGPDARLARALAGALAIVVALNIWLGVRVPVLLQDADMRYLDVLAARVDAFPARTRVKLLVLGNSHMLAGLRPPEVAQAFGLAPDEVFSLALPGATALELTLLAERHVPRFPAVRAVLLGVDEFVFTARFESIVRYATRGAFADRWRWARHALTWDERLARQAVRLVPFMDFKDLLVGAWQLDRRLFLRRMVGPGPAPAGPRALVDAQPWPWGLPPPWEAKRPYGPIEAARPMAAEAVNRRARQFMPEDTDVLVAAGLVDLAELLDDLARARLAVAVVEPPYQPRLVTALATVTEGRHSRYRERLTAFFAARGIKPVPPPPGLTAADFYDVDHVAPSGARKTAEWLAQRLRAEPVGRALAPRFAPRLKGEGT